MRLLVVYLLVLPLAAVSPNGAIIGTVTDPTNLPVAGAKIILRNHETNAAREVETNVTGEYYAPVLPSAFYEVAVEMPGFRRAVHPRVKLDVGQTERVDFQLELGELDQQIIVEEAPPAIQSDTSGLGQVVDRQKIVELPLNQRNFLNLAWLVPGAQLPADGSQNSSQTEGAAVSVNGAREQSNNYLLDGVDNNDQSINIYAALPSVDAIQEFRVHSSNFSAEFGRTGGSQINVVLKSGTNDVHGTAFWFLRNRHLDAKNFFDAPDCAPASVPGTCGEIPRFDRNQFGGTFGGPLRHDSTFVFVSYEGLRQRQAITRGATVPSQLQRAGALAAVPPSIRNSAGENAFNLYPAANVGTDLSASNRFLGSPVLRNEIDQFLVKVNQNFSEKDTLYGHYTIYDQDRFNPYDPFQPFTNLPGFGSFNLNRGQNAAGTWIHSFNPRLVNEARFGYSRLRADIIHENSGTNKSQGLGFPDVKTDPIDLGYPNVTVAGFDGIGEPTNTPQQRIPQTFHFADTLAWNPELGGGRHQFKVGGEVRRIHLDFFLDPLARGLWEFFGDFTGDPLQDLLLGTPRWAITTSGDTFTNLRTTSVNWFVQDDIRLHPRFTLNLGVRYEFNSPPTDTQDRLSIPDVSAASEACTPQPDCQFIRAGTDGVPRATYEADKNNFAPRIGLAWRPVRSDRFVLRAAYGVFFDVGILNANATARFNPPFFTTLLAFNSGSNTIQDIVDQPGFPLVTPLVIASDFRNGYMQDWQGSFQYELNPGLVVEAGYVGTKGTGLIDVRNPNQPAPGGAPPYPQFGSWQYVESGASSIHHGAIARVEQRWRQGLSFLGSYTWSKTIDNASAMFETAGDPAFPQDSQNMRAERGLANFHANHRFSGSFLYNLPLGAGRKWLANRGVSTHILGNWRLGGIVTLQSGRPFTVTRVGDQSGTGAGTIADSDRPDLIADPFQPGPVAYHPDPACHTTTSQGGRAVEIVNDPASWFNPCAFAVAPGRFGTAGRNAFIGPNLLNVDFSLLKDVLLSGERQRLQFRFEVFNLFNRPNFDLPDASFDSATFGQILSANAFLNKPPRQIQLGLKYIF